MKIFAGKIVSELPFGWEDDTEFVFNSKDQRVSLKIADMDADPGQSINQLLDGTEERFGDVGEVKPMHRSVVKIHGLDSGQAKLGIDPGGGRDRYIIRILIIRFSPNRVVRAILHGPVALDQRMDTTWSLFTDRLNLAEAGGVG